MKRTSLTTLVLLVSAGSAAGQISPITPNCSFDFMFSNRAQDVANPNNLPYQTVYAISGTTSSTVIDNTACNADAWTVKYTVEGLTLVTIEIDGASLSRSVLSNGGLAKTSNGSVLWPGGVSSGSNPISLVSPTNSIVTLTGYSPYINAKVSNVVGTGSVEIELDGWRRPQFFNVPIPAPGTNGGSIGPQVTFNSGLTTPVNVKTTAGSIIGFSVYNTTGATCWLNLFNALAANVTTGTTVATNSFEYATSASGMTTVILPAALYYTTAISMAGTTSAASAAGTCSLVVNIAWQ
jgi:hypothetical protein